MAKNNLMLGNCLDRMQEIGDKSVDMVLCDLPYGTTQNKWDSRISLTDLWEQYDRICKDNCAILLFGQTPFDKILGCSNLELLRYEWVWEKTNATGHLNAKKMPLKCHENILVFYKKLPTYNPIKTDGHVRKQSKSKTVDKSMNYGAQKEAIDYDSTQRYPRDILKFSKDKQKLSLHPTQKPVALCEYLIRTYTAYGDTVLDNCMGSGTTGVACKNVGRNFIGVEMDSGYFDIAVSRIGVTNA